MTERNFIDSHAHLTSSPLYEGIDGVLARSEAAGIKKIINICTDSDSLDKGIEIAQKHSSIFNAAAVHPHDAEKEGERQFPFIEKAAKEKAIIAIGETGLDYHYTHSARDIQQHYLRKHLQLALSCKLPVVIHCREAFSDFFAILDEEYIIDHQHAPGVLHCFTGTIDEAKEVLKRGWFISISGIVTFKKSVELREVAKMVPLNRLLIETDAPYLAPQSHRGKQNEPSYLIETAAAIASIKGVSIAELGKVTSENTERLFKI